MISKFPNSVWFVSTQNFHYSCNLSYIKQIKQSQELPVLGTHSTLQYEQGDAAPPSTGVRRLCPNHEPFKALRGVSYGPCSPSILGFIRLIYCNECHHLHGPQHLAPRLPNCKSMAFPGQTAAKDIFSYTVTLMYCEGGDYCHKLKVAPPGCRRQFPALAGHSEGNSEPWG